MRTELKKPGAGGEPAGTEQSPGAVKAVKAVCKYLRSGDMARACPRGTSCMISAISRKQF